MSCWRTLLQLIFVALVTHIAGSIRLARSVALVGAGSFFVDAIAHITTTVVLACTVSEQKKRESAREREKERERERERERKEREISKCCE